MVLDVLTLTMPVTLQVKKRKVTYLFTRADSESGLMEFIERDLEMSRAVGQCCCKNIFLAMWQNAWNESENGRWNYRLNPDLKVCIKRKN